MTEEGMYIAKTYTVNDSNFQKRLDEERPVVDFRQTIPPKFAKTLVSLLRIEPPLRDKRILDPFCGLGTILQFGHMVGYDIYGTDIKQEHVDASRENLAFTADVLQNKLSDKHLKSHVKKSAVEKVSDLFPREFFDGIATEPMLFPFFKDYPEDQSSAEIFKNDVVGLYKDLLEQAHLLLKPKCRIALVSPVIFQARDKLQVPIESIGNKYGFKTLKLLSGDRVFDSPREDISISEYNFKSILDTGSKRLAREFFLLQK